MPALKEAAILREYGPLKDDALAEALRGRNVKTYQQRSEGFWGESVSEFALALTLCALRRIPQTHAAMIHAHDVWDYSPAGGMGKPGQRGHQFGDDLRFTNGTVEGKRVRIVGAGNIASRYASFMRTLGADVAAWDPFASEPAFHRAGSRREHHLERLVRDAEIFAPMVPLTDSTRGLVTREHINALPKGCLVVLATRALICDMPAIRRRVLKDEIALAADVFDVEPLPLDDPLLGRHNVVHTPHNAGRTKETNTRWAEMLAEQFLPR
jgi:phosphoglycerate dehydrogenase-like enzyme